MHGPRSARGAGPAPIQHELVSIAHAHGGAGVACAKLGRKVLPGLLATGGDDHHVRLWSLARPAAPVDLTGHQSPVTCVEFDHGEGALAAGAHNGTVKVFDLQAGKVTRTLTGHRASCLALAFHRDGLYLVSGSADTNAKVWDLRQRDCIRTVRGHAAGVAQLAISPDSQMVATGCSRGVVKVWDFATGRALADFNAHGGGAVSDLQFHPQEFVLASAGADRQVQLWDLDSWGPLGALGPEALPVRGLTFSPQGSHMLAATQEAVKVYATESMAPLDHLPVDWGGRLADLALSADGQRLVGASLAGGGVAALCVDVQQLRPWGSRPPLQPRPSGNNSRHAASGGREQQHNHKQQPAVQAGAHSSSHAGPPGRMGPLRQQLATRQPTPPASGRASGQPSPVPRPEHAAAAPAAAARVPGGEAYSKAVPPADTRQDGLRRDQQQAAAGPTQAAVTADLPQHGRAQHRQQEQAQAPVLAGGRSAAGQLEVAGSSTGMSPSNHFPHAEQRPGARFEAGSAPPAPQPGQAARLRDSNGGGAGPPSRRGEGTTPALPPCPISAAALWQGDQVRQQQQQQQQQQEPAAATQQRQDPILEAAAARPNTAAELSSLLGALQVARGFVSRGNVDAALRSVASHGDPGAAAMLLGALRGQQAVYQLGNVEPLCKVLDVLLAGGRPAHVAAALDVLALVLRGPGQVIRDCCSGGQPGGGTPGGRGVDLQAEARRERAAVAQLALQGLGMRLGVVARGAPGAEAGGDPLLAARAAGLAEELGALA